MIEYIVRESGYPGTIKKEIVGEIVRCKDCKFHTYEEIGMVYCPGNIVGGWVENDFFCKDGERRDE